MRGGRVSTYRLDSRNVMQALNPKYACMYIYIIYIYSIYIYIDYIVDLSVLY